MPGLGLGTRLTKAGGNGATTTPITSFWALNFDGDDYAISTGAVSALSGKTTGSMAVWADIITGAVECIPLSLAATTSSSTTIMIRNFYRGIIVYCIVDGATQWKWTGTSQVSVDTWHHIAISHNGTTPSFFIDCVPDTGVFDDSTNLTAWWKDVVDDATVKANAVSIGSGWANGSISNPNKGEVAQVIFSSDVWDSADVCRIGLKKDLQDENPLVYYPMLPGSGQICNDKSGNGFNAQLGSTSGSDTNDPTWVGPYTGIGASGPT